MGRYEVLVPIASGGMATVYLARSRGAHGFERDVAVKLTHKHLRDVAEFHDVLVEEAKLAASIRHNNVVSVLDVGDDPQGLFLVMDYVEGDTLSGLVRRARNSGEAVPRRIGLRILLDALAGVHAAHETRDPMTGAPLSIVHRDFSPHNILVGTDGVGRLTDFGIAKAASRSGHTSTGVIKGKVAYMAPEQARGGAVDRRCDVWAAGVVAWELVANRQMWPREEDMTTLIKLVTQAPPSLREAAPDVPEDVEAAIMKALAVEPNDRWPTASAFAGALMRALVKCDWLAEVDEVSTFVRTAVGPKLQHRREQANAALELRNQLGEVAEQTLATPSNLRVSAPSLPEAVSAPVTEDATQISSPAAQPPSPQALPTPMTAPVTEQPSTGTNSSVAMPAPPMRRGVAPKIAVAATVFALSIVIGVAVLEHQRSQTAAVDAPTTATTTAATATETATATGAPTTTVAHTTTATPPATASSSATTPTHTAATVVTSAPLVTATATTTTAATAKPTSTTKLAPSPFADPAKTTGSKLAPSPF